MHFVSGLGGFCTGASGPVAGLWRALPMAVLVELQFEVLGLRLRAMHPQAQATKDHERPAHAFSRCRGTSR